MPPRYALRPLLELPTVTRSCFLFLPILILTLIECVPAEPAQIPIRDPIPLAPYLLSIEVQNIAGRLDVMNRDPQVQQRGLTHYLDLLTAADLIAAHRAEYQRRQTTEADFIIAFAALCVPLPNKPSLPPSVTSTLRKSLDGLYISDTKRQSFTQALKAFLLEATEETVVFNELRGIKTASEYGRSFIDLAIVRP